MNTLVLNMPATLAELKIRFEEFLQVAIGLNPQEAEACKGDYRVYVVTPQESPVDMQALPELGAASVEQILADENARPDRQPFGPSPDPSFDRYFMLSGNCRLDGCQLLFLSRGASFGTVYYPVQNKDGSKGFDYFHSPFYDLVGELDDYPAEHDEDHNTYVYEREAHLAIVETLLLDE